MCTPKGSDVTASRRGEVCQVGVTQRAEVRVVQGEDRSYWWKGMAYSGVGRERKITLRGTGKRDSDRCVDAVMSEHPHIHLPYVDVPTSMSCPSPYLQEQLGAKVAEHVRLVQFAGNLEEHHAVSLKCSHHK